MSNDERLNGTLQENIITLLAHNDEVGKLVVNIVEPNLFEGDYRVIAERCITFWKEHNRAPAVHLVDLLSDIIDDKNNRKAGTFHRILNAMFQLAPEINTKYVMDQLRQFVRLQEMKGAILEAAALLNQPSSITIPRVETILSDILRARDMSFDPGLRIHQVDHLLDYLDTQFHEFTTGIREFDQRHIVPSRGTVMCLLAPTGRGKSWWLMHLGKRAFMARKKVVHISLELSAEELMQRYWQSLYGAPKRQQTVEVTNLQLKKGELEGIKKTDVNPEWAFDSNTLKMEMDTRLEVFGSTFENLIIKRFPPRRLTPDMLRAYLDSLETVEHFIPDMLIIDYAQLMKTDEKNYRISLGRVYEEFRGIAIERNIACVTAHQTSRQSSTAKQTLASHVSEDWSIVQTSDIVLTYSATSHEQRHGLARMYVSKARTEEDSFGVLITQSYKLGQYALDSVLMQPKYFEFLDDLEKEEEEDAEDEDNADE